MGEFLAPVGKLDVRPFAARAYSLAAAHAPSTQPCNIEPTAYKCLAWFSGKRSAKRSGVARPCKEFWLFSSVTLMSIAGNAQDLVITNARIITGTGAVVDSGSVVVADGQIVSFSEGAAAADPDVMTIDAGGRTVMPGFIDGHRHVIRGEPVSWLAEQAEQRMQEYLEAGFTTIQSCGDSLDEILELRRRLDSGELNGPRLIVSGRVPLARSSGPRPDVDPARIDISRPPHRPTEAAAAIPEGETRAAVQSLAEAGVDAIKTVIIITPEGPETGTLSVIADESAQVGVRSITHAVTVVDTMAAVEANTHVLVHTPHIGQMTEEQARIVAESGIPMVSTLGIFVPTFADDNVLIRDRTGHDNLPRFRDLDPFPFETLSSAGQGPVNARLLWDAGVTYGYGTDTIFLPGMRSLTNSGRSGSSSPGRTSWRS